jgi:hypothetical protein
MTLSGKIHKHRTICDVTWLTTTDENRYSYDVDDDGDNHDKFEEGTSWQEGMNSISDVVHPELTSPRKGERLPTLLLPWSGGNGFLNTNGSGGSSHNSNYHNNKKTDGGGTGTAGLLRRTNSFPLSRNNRELNGRQ